MQKIISGVARGRGGLAAPVAARRGRQRNIVALGEGGIGGAKILKKIMAPPFSVIKIVKYCGVVGGEHWGRQNPKKYNGAPLSVIKIVKYCGVWGGGHWGRQNTKKIMAPPSLSLRLLSIVAFGEGGGHQNPAKDNSVPFLRH